MTNEQLAVLLRKYSEWLEIAIAQLDRELPADLPRHEEVYMLGKSPGHLVCLDGLVSLKYQMVDDTHILVGEKAQ